jgi:hypothetical protein
MRLGGPESLSELLETRHTSLVTVTIRTVRPAASSLYRMSQSGSRYACRKSYVYGHTLLTLYSPVVIICTAQWSLYVSHSGHYMYHQFNIQQFYVLRTQYLRVLCGSENKQRLFPYATLTALLFCKFLTTGYQLYALICGLLPPSN